MLIVTPGPFQVSHEGEGKSRSVSKPVLRSGCRVEGTLLLSSPRQIFTSRPRVPGGALSPHLYFVLLILPLSSHSTIMDFCGVLAFQLQPLLLTNYPVFGASFTHILERGNLVASTCFWLQMLSLWGASVWMHWFWVTWTFRANP